MSKKFLTLTFLPVFICAMLSFLVSTAEAQVNQEWIKTFSLTGSVRDWFGASVVDADGNIYMTGHYRDAEEGENCVTVKFNSAGNLQWVRTRNEAGNRDEVAYAIAVDSAGNVYVTGTSGLSAKFSWYILTIKYDSDGNEQWIGRYSGILTTGNAVAVDGSGNVYVAGNIWNDFITIKYNSAGVQQWVKIYNGPGNGGDGALAIAIDGSGNICVTGQSTGTEGNLDYVIIKYNPEGVEQWVQRYNGLGNGNDRPTSITTDVLNNVYVTGYSRGSGTADDYATIMYNSAGTEQWIQRYNGIRNYNDQAYAIAVDGSGNIYVTGIDYTDYATIKYNSAGTEQWIKKYNGPANSTDYATAMAIDGSGNIYVTGYSYGSLETKLDYATIKYDSAGTEEWVQRYNGPGNDGDEAYGIAIDRTGNIYVAGYSTGLGTGWDFAAVKYNSEGVQQWEGRYDQTGNVVCNPSSMAVDGLGNIYIAGYTENVGSSYDFLTLKYNPAGLVQWVQIYNGTGNSYDQVNGMAVDGSGNICITGSSYGSGSNADYLTIKYNSAGTEQWNQSFNGPENRYDYPTAMAIDEAGNIYVTGYSYGGSGTNYDFATVKYNSAGLKQWDKRYNGTGNYYDKANAIAIDGSGNIYVTGSSDGTDSYGDCLTIKYSPAGDELWTQRYDGTGNSNDTAKAIVCDGSGNIYVTGSSYGSGSSYDYTTIKYNSAGDELWIQRYNGPGNSTDYAAAITIDGSGNIYITGMSYGSGTQYDFATIKYNSEGDSLWVSRYNGPRNSTDQAAAIVIDGSGNIYVAGSSMGGGYLQHLDYAIVKYNSAGVEQWVQRYDDVLNSGNIACALAIDGSKNIYITGTRKLGSYSGIIETVKYSQLLPPSAPLLISPEDNSTGLPLTPSMLWNTSESADKYNMQIASDQDFTNILINQTNITDTIYSITDTIFTTNTLYFWRVNAENSIGTSEWSDIWCFVTYATPQENTQMLISDINSLQEAGALSPGNATALKYQLSIALGKINDNKFNAAIRILVSFINHVQSFITENILTPEQGQSLIDQANSLIEQLSGDNIKNTAHIPKEFRLYQNYPNPFNPAANIRYDIPKTSHVRLVIYNTLGQEIETLVNETLQPGSYKAVWNANNQASGVYFYRLVTADFTDVKKMVLIK